MTPWWNNLIKLWEMPDATALDTKRCPGIHYVVKQALDKCNLFNDIGTVLERGLRGERAPAGLVIGNLRPGSVGLSFTRKEVDDLYANGYNPIIVERGVPYVWGQRFFNDGQVHQIANMYGLTPEFRAFMAKPLIQSGFYDPLYEEEHKAEKAPIIALTPQQAALHRAVTARAKAFGLVTWETREVD